MFGDFFHGIPRFYLNLIDIFVSRCRKITRDFAQNLSGPGPFIGPTCRKPGIAYTNVMRLLIMSAALLLSSPAFAGDEEYTIKVIQDDGSVAVIDLRESDAPIPAPAEPAPPRVVAPEPAPTPAPIARPRVPEGFEQQASAPPVTEEEAKPVEKPKKETKKKKRKVVKRSPPGPKFKPRRAPEGAEITPALAMSIAIDHAPPSSDMKIFRSEYEGQPAFAVVFKTEEGFEEVLVDSVSGKVLKVRESEHFSAQTKPGHLPGTLR